MHFPSIHASAHLPINWKPPHQMCGAIYGEINNITSQFKAVIPCAVINISKGPCQPDASPYLNTFSQVLKFQFAMPSCHCRIPYCRQIVNDVEGVGLGATQQQQLKWNTVYDFSTKAIFRFWRRYWQDNARLSPPHLLHCCVVVASGCF